MLQQAGGFPAADTDHPLLIQKRWTMKKLVAFALILGLGMFSVVGCGGPDTKKPADKGGAAAPAKTLEKTPDKTPAK
jgi:hypothetical protein